MSEQINNILNDVEIYIKDRQSSSDWVEGRDQINYSGTYYDHREYVAAVKTLLSGWMGMGKDSNHFESLFPRHLGKKFGSLVNSGSSANLLMYATLLSKNAYGLKKGTRIITPVAGFPTTINPILQLGFEPVFVDIELNTLNIDIDQFYNACKTSNAQVVCFAHVLGNPPNIDKILEIEKQRIKTDNFIVNFSLIHFLIFTTTNFSAYYSTTDEFLEKRKEIKNNNR